MTSACNDSGAVIQLLSRRIRGDLEASRQAREEQLRHLLSEPLSPLAVADAHYLAEGEAEMNVDVLERADMEKLGMHALLSVARGSRQPPKLIVIPRPLLVRFSRHTRANLVCIGHRLDCATCNASTTSSRSSGASAAATATVSSRTAA